MGVRAAGRRGDDARSRCSRGMRVTVGLDDCGRSWARAMGRKAARKERDGIGRAAITVQCVEMYVLRSVKYAINVEVHVLSSFTSMLSKA